MPDMSTSNPRSPLNVGDLVSTEFDDGILITITRTREYYRVTALDYWRRPIRDGRNFQGQGHFQEREARYYARRLHHEVYTGGQIRWTVYRADSGNAHTETREPIGQLQPA